MRREPQFNWVSQMLRRGLCHATTECATLPILSLAGTVISRHYNWITREVTAGTPPTTDLPMKALPELPLRTIPITVIQSTVLLLAPLPTPPMPMRDHNNLICHESQQRDYNNLIFRSVATSTINNNPSRPTSTINKQPVTSPHKMYQPPHNLTTGLFSGFLSLIFGPPFGPPCYLF